MAEIQTNSQKQTKNRFVKRSTRVDLTPMVDLGFLLITFFVFTTTMSQQTAMNINLPFDKTIITDDVCESCVLTVLLDEDNRVKYYEGAPENNPSIMESDYSPEKIRKVLMDKKFKVAELRGNADAFILIIKPTAGSNFKNFVDITDEAKICDIKRFYIDEVKPADQLILSQRL